jgi:hypothetical protein
MRDIQTALKPSTNITLIIFSGLIIAVTFFNSSALQLFFVLFGLIFGIAAGIIQVLSYRESPSRFISAQSMVEIRNVLIATNWGQKYIRLYWIGNGIFVIVQFYCHGNWLINFLTMHFTFLFIRELITLRTTFDLQEMAKNRD